MFEKKGERVVVIERYGAPMSEKQVTEALGGQHNGSTYRAIETILCDFIAAFREISESPDLTPDQRTFYCGKAAAMGDLLAELRQKTGADRQQSS